MACSTSVTCGTSRIGCTCSRRTKMNLSICSGQWRITTPVRSPSAIHEDREQAQKSNRNRGFSKSAKRKLCSMGATWQSSCCPARRLPRRAHAAQLRLLEIGKAEVVQHGRDVAIFGLGNMFEVAEEAARKLEEKGISVALINPRWIKPMDTGTLEFFARGVEVVCTIED